MLIKKKKGQSTVEYIILVTLVIGAILAFQGTFQGRVTDSMGNATDGMVNMAQRLNGAFAP